MATEIIYPYPVPAIADMEARLLLAGVEVAAWQPMTAYEIRDTHAGYQSSFEDVEADAVQVFSESEGLADEVALTSGSGNGLTDEEKTELLRAAGLIQPETIEQIETTHTKLQEAAEGEAPVVVIPASEVPDTCAVYIDLTDVDWDTAEAEGQLFEAFVEGNTVPVLWGDTFLPHDSRFTALTGEANPSRPGLAVLNVPQSASLSRNGVAGVPIKFRCNAGRLRNSVALTVPSEAGPVNIKDLLYS